MIKPDTTLLCQIASCIASKQFSKLSPLLRRNKSGNFAGRVYEVILQSYLFCGFPAALESLKTFKIVYPTYKPNKNNLNLRDLKASGIKTCKIVYGKNYEKLLANVNKLSPDINEWMLVEGYGKVLSREGLELKERELINVAILCTNYYKVQLYSHIKGALNNGASKDEIQKVIKATEKFNTVKNLKAAAKILLAVPPTIL